MPLYNKAEMSEQAQKNGFLRDTFEKVYRLTRILGFFQSNDVLRKHLILKGGTAINLTIFNLPRLSVDIDLDYTPNDTKEDTQMNRERISIVIRDYMKEEGYILSEQSRFSYSLDAFHFLYQNSSGNRDMIKIELNYSLRAQLFQSMEREVLTTEFGERILIQTLNPIEIFAAKTNALLTRTAARDLYDFCNMVSNRLFVECEELFRKSVVFYATISSDNVDTVFYTESIDRLTFHKIRRDLFPVLTNREAHEHFNLDGQKEMAKSYKRQILNLNEEEREYIERFKKLEYKPELLFSDEEILQRIEKHPMAIWKCRKK